MKTFWLTVCLLAASAAGTDYYVATTGSDAADGAIGTPFATIQKGLDTAVAGDTIHVRGGTYRESLTLKRSGSSGTPITLKEYTGETVILDGGYPITSWTQCASDEAGLTRGGTTNPNYASIYKATIPLANIPYQDAERGPKVALFNDGVFCEVSQNPDTDKMLAHNWNQDGWFSADSASTTAFLQDTDQFTSSDTGYYDDCRLYISHSGNAIYWRGVDSYDPSTHRITLSTAYDEDITAANTYAVSNHPLDVDEAGEYCFTWEADGSGNITVYYFANNAGELTDGSLTYGRYGPAMTVNNYDYYVIDGLEIRSFCHPTTGSDAALIYSAGNYLVTGWEIKNCNIHDFSYPYLIYSYLSNFSMHDNTFSNVGYYHNNGTILVATASSPSYCSNLNIYSNTITGSTNSSVLRFLVTRNSLIYDNTITCNTGAHGNGTSFYQGCYNVVYAYNYSKGSNVRLTVQDIGDQSYAVASGLGGSIYVYSNVLQTTSDDAQAFAWWIDTTSRDDTGSLYFMNNLLTSGGADNYPLFLNNNDQGGPAYVYNNLIEYCQKGAWAGEAATTYSNNIHFGLPSPTQYTATDFATGGKLVNDLLYDGSSGRPSWADVLVDFDGYDYTAGDYALVSGSDAIGAGKDISTLLPSAYFTTFNFSRDIAGNARTLTAPAIGPLEYTAAPEPLPEPDPDPEPDPSPTKAAIGLPADTATDQLVTTALSWTDGGWAHSYNVYFGTDSTPDETELVGNQTAVTYSPGTLAYSTTYYWRIDAVNDTGTTTGDVWSFTTVSEVTLLATVIGAPANAATGQSATVSLSWTNGGGATSYDVYFGTDSTPDDNEFCGNQTDLTYSPGTLTRATTYYWRIDAVNDTGIVTGTTWSFTTAAFAASAPEAVRLIPFEYSTDTSYVLELGPGYIRFYTNGGRILQ